MARSSLPLTKKVATFSAGDYAEPDTFVGAKFRLALIFFKHANIRCIRKTSRWARQASIPAFIFRIVLPNVAKTLFTPFTTSKENRLGRGLVIAEKGTAVTNAVNLNAEMPAPVVLIDDDKDFLDAQVQALELAGFTVQAFLSGAEAIRHITREFEGVVVSDVRMPNMDGLSLFKHVHELDPELPVLLLTGHGDVPMAVQALKDGVYELLTKPFSVAELTASLRRAIQKRELVIESRNLRRLHGG